MRDDSNEVAGRVDDGQAGMSVSSSALDESLVVPDGVVTDAGARRASSVDR
jgi:hypothetical protein